MFNKMNGADAWLAYDNRIYQVQDELLSGNHKINVCPIKWVFVSNTRITYGKWIDQI